MPNNIPVLNFAKFRNGSSADQKNFAKTLGAAFHEVGFLALENHGLEPSFMQLCHDTARKIFDLPSLVKETYSDFTNPATPRGYMILSPDKQDPHYKTFFKESWHIGRSEPNMWPNEVLESKTVYMNLYEKLEAIAFSLLKASSIALGKNSDHFHKHLENNISLLRILHYPEVNNPGAQQRMVPHKDLSLITLLYEPNMDGLEIESKDKSWMRIENMKNMLFVNIGELFSYITENYFYCANHRVVTTKMGRRISFPLFIIPNPTLVLESISDHTLPVKTTGQYLMEKIPDLPRY